MKVSFRNQAALIRELASGKYAGRAMHAVVLHDDGCTPSRCTCSPEYILEDLTPETFKAGARAQDAWVRGA